MRTLLLLSILLAPGLAQAQTGRSLAFPRAAPRCESAASCELPLLEARLRRANAELGGHDDTAPATMVAVGIPLILTGLIGALTSGPLSGCARRDADDLFGYSYCAERTPTNWELRGTMIGIGAVGLISTVLGAVWLVANGRPYRARDALHRRVLRLREGARLDASLSPSEVSLSLALTF